MQFRIHRPLEALSQKKSVRVGGSPITKRRDELQPEFSLRGICSVIPPPLISKTSQVGKRVTFKRTPNAGRISGRDVDRLDEIEIVVPLIGKAQDSMLEVLKIARRLGHLLTFLVGMSTTVQPYRYFCG